jgi:hypothetical protein
MATNGLTRRLDNIERVVEAQYFTRDEVGTAIMQKVFEQADRYRVRPAPPIEMQSPGEQCIRGALADAEGAEDVHKYARRFWASFTARIRLFIQEHDS